MLNMSLLVVCLLSYDVIKLISGIMLGLVRLLCIQLQ